MNILVESTRPVKTSRPARLADPQESVDVGMTAQESFTAALPTMELTIAFNLRGCPRRDREELMQVARVAAWVAWSSLMSRGIDPIAAGVTGIAFMAARTARARRRDGGAGAGVRGAGRDDIMDAKARADGWERCSVPDYLATLHDVGARLDYLAWLETLSAIRQRVATMLVEGYKVFEVARACGITSGRISQMRHELLASWQEHQDA